MPGPADEEIVPEGKGSVRGVRFAFCFPHQRIECVEGAIIVGRHVMECDGTEA